MRLICTLLTLLYGIVLFAQPSNDDCTTATVINLASPAPCPSSNPAVTIGNYSNIDATPTSPYPTFTGCNSGGSTTGPAAEVWFTFTAVANQTQIAVNGLGSPQIVVYENADCSTINPIDCASGTGSAGLTINTLVGNTYYLLVSGGDVNDQGNFSLNITSFNNCNPCLNGSDFQVLPPPVNGVYTAGQTVQVCYTITEWDVTGTIEWLHSVEFQFGPGWNVSSITPIPPPSCDGQGQWLFLGSWTSSNTGQVFGPGFAYDSGLGGALDGNPGNNWGDGGTNPFDGTDCADIGGDAPAVNFCVNIQVADCPPNNTGDNLNINVNVWSDGDSGSWTQTGCNSGSGFNFLASVVCCDDLEPLVIDLFDETCPGSCNGSVTFQGNNPNGMGAWNYLVQDAGGSVVFQENASNPGPVTVTGLCPGAYTITATNVATNCTRSTNIVIGSAGPPDALASNDGPACPGNPVNLSATTTTPGVSITYSWTGPNGFTSNSPNPQVTEPGDYTLIVTVDGCDSDPATTTVSFVNASITASATPNPLCNGDQLTLSAPAGYSNYDWGPYGTGQVVVLNQTFPPGQVTFTVTATDISGCPVTDDVTVDVLETPVPIIDDPGPVCLGSTVDLTVSGGPFADFFWDNGGFSNPQTIDVTQINQLVSVTVTGLNGCQADTDITLDVSDAPMGAASASGNPICEGDPVTLSATGGDFYDWSSGQSGATIVETPASTTDYSVTITNAAGCADTVDLTVIVEPAVPAPVVNCTNITPNSVTFSWAAIPGASGYDLQVLTGQTGTLNGTDFVVTGLNPGEDVTLSVAAITGGVCDGAATTVTCTAQDCPPVTVTIDPVADICLTGAVVPIDLEATIGSTGGTENWSGPGIIDAASGLFDPLAAGPGDHLITLTYTEGTCVYSADITLSVFEVPTADFGLDLNLVCTDDPVQVTYAGSAGPSATYTWDFDGGTANPGTGPGPHTVSWPAAGTYTVSLTVTENGCTSSAFTEVVTVEEALDPPVITCADQSTTSVLFSWPDVAGASSYNATVLTGQTGILNGTTFEVTGLGPGETVTLEVEAVGSGPCGSSTAQQTCSAQNCPNFAITIDPVADICLNASAMPFDLTANVSGGTGAGTGSWSGPGITDPVAGTFDPALAGAGQHDISYTYAEGPCTDSASIPIGVFDLPAADFTAAPSPICVNSGTTTLTYTGGAGPGATYTWNFNGGAANPGTGPGPHTVSWPSPGIKTISLVVEENGCASTPFSVDVAVEAPIEAPVVNCSSTTSQITFTWASVAGAIDYQVNVLTGPTGTLDDTSYIVTGLTAGDEVEIEVIALSGNSCPDNSTTISCIAEDCPTFVIGFDPVDDICLDASAVPIDLNATVSGGMGGGTESWSGPGITDAALGTFDPALAGVGTHVISFNYQEGNCTGNASLSVTVRAQPTADFTAGSPICINGTTNVVYAGSATAGATYTWDFDGGTANPGAGPGPHTVSWTTPGTKTIRLTVDENGCVSDAFTRTVEVEDLLPPPVVSCSATDSSVLFTWADVPGASSYQVVVLSGPAGTQSGKTYEVTGLSPLQEVVIEVVAVSGGVCGNSSMEASCVAQDCPALSATLSGPPAICQGDEAALEFVINSTTAGPFELVYAIDGQPQPPVLVGSTHTETVSLSDTATVRIVQIVDQSLSDCTYNPAAEITIAVNSPGNSGSAGPTPGLCEGTDSTLLLDNLLVNADPGGQWEAVSALPAGALSGNALQTGNLAAGTYQLRYRLDAPDPCPDPETLVSVRVEPLPLADAGADQDLLCNQEWVTLGGPNTSEGPGFAYLWTGPGTITDPSDRFTEVDAPGLYTLEVTSPIGCVSRDEVSVSEDLASPVATVNVRDMSCFQSDDGALFIEEVTGGQPPYTYSLDGGPFTSQTSFTNLGPGTYQVTIMDQNGCSSSIEVDISQPDELVVTLVTNLEGNGNTIAFGDSIQLTALYNPNVTLDTIIWQPDSLASGNDNSIWVSPEGTTNFRVQIVDRNGCSDTDDMMIVVQKPRPVFIPNAFSPNGDGRNDRFFIQAGPQVAIIRTFQVYNRWGETMYTLNNFQPNEESLGWDGTHRGKEMDSGVYVYYAEVEFTDGFVDLFKGDITLLR